MRPVIHSKKHYVQMSLGNVAVANRTIIDLITVVANPTVVDQVEEGASVKAIFIELWLLNESTAGSEIVTISKQIDGASGPGFSEMVALGTWTGKKNIFFTHQGLSGNDSVGNPSVVLRNWIKIPKSKQRFGLGDALRLTIANPTVGSELLFCGFATYKEYS